jgi:hypothetical protein
MLSVDSYLAQRMIEIKVAEAFREAETRRLIHQMGGGQPTWLVRTTCWLLCQVGRALVSLGRWLQRSATPRSVSLDCTRSPGHESLERPTVMPR